VLFSIPKNEKPSATEQMAFFDDCESQSFSLQSMNDLKEHLGKIEQNRHYRFWSKGQWSMHELLEFLLLQTGASDVYLTTWTITEDPMRKIFLLKKKGLIKSLHCVLDQRIKGNKPGPFQLLKNTADSLRLTQCHAKSLVLVNGKFNVSVLGSANLSRNPRLEAGTISTNKEAVNFDLNIIKNAIDY
jgi:hypothetical protein